MTMNQTDQREKSVMRHHEDDKHDGKKMRFDMKLINSYMKDPLTV